MDNSYIHKKNETLIEIRTSLENLWQRTIHLSDFFQNSLVLIPKRKCLVGCSRVRCGESGTPSTIIYTRWSHWHEELGCYASMVNRTPRNKFQWNSNQNTNFFIHENSSENIVCQMAAILSRPQYVNPCGSNTWVVTIPWGVPGDRNIMAMA